MKIDRFLLFFFLLFMQTMVCAYNNKAISENQLDTPVDSVSVDSNSVDSVYIKYIGPSLSSICHIFISKTGDYTNCVSLFGKSSNNYGLGSHRQRLMEKINDIFVKHNGAVIQSYQYTGAIVVCKKYQFFSITLYSKGKRIVKEVKIEYNDDQGYEIEYTSTFLSLIDEIEGIAQYIVDREKLDD